MRIWLAALLLVGGCTPADHFPYVRLIDQRTFAPSGTAPTAADLKNLPALPLATVRFDVPDEDFTPALAEAVEAATARKPDVEFDVIAPVAHGATPGPYAAEDAATVARAIAEQSVPPERIHLGVVEDAGTPAREIRVYVR
jgi:hypothetical protein